LNRSDPYARVPSGDGHSSRAQGNRLIPPGNWEVAETIERAIGRPFFIAQTLLRPARTLVAVPRWVAHCKEVPMIKRLFSSICLALIVLAGCSKQPPDVPQVSDLDVTEHVKTALQQDDALKGFNIAVVTQKGDVRLTGVLDSQAQVDAALKIARTAEGAHTIHDELTLKK
jgi:hypothetical protein